VKAIPIIVPLYKSYHCLERFIQSLELEKRQPYICFFLDNEFKPLGDGRPFVEQQIMDICEKYGFNLLKYVALVSKNNYLYSESVNMLVDEATRTCEFDKFVVLNPDCYALKENWLSDMVACWDSIKRNFDKRICTLGSLQWGNEEKTQVWHMGCMWKPEDQKCHLLDWAHVHHIPDNLVYTGGGVGFHKVDGNTGTGIMIDYQKFAEMEGFDSKNFPHYSSDAFFVQETQYKGYTHYCCTVEFFHQAGNSVKN